MKIKNFSTVLLVLLFSACAFLDSGYYNHNGKYVPKRPNYKLKDKQGSVYSIDTTSVYKLVQEYSNFELIYPIYSAIENVDSRYNFINRHNFYMKFCEKGRFFEFFALKDSLKITDFDRTYIVMPNSYYTCNGQDIKTETFMRGDATGFYDIKNYVVNKSMDTLILTPEKYRGGSYSIYKRVSIPVNFKKFKIDW